MTKYVARDSFYVELACAAGEFIARASNAHRPQLKHVLRRLIEDPTQQCPYADTVYYAHRSTESNLSLPQLVSLALNAELLSHSAFIIERMMGRALTYDQRALHLVFDYLDSYMVAGFISAQVFARIASRSPIESYSVISSLHRTSRKSMNREGPLGFEMRLHTEAILRMALARCTEVTVRRKPKKLKTNGYYNEQLPLQYAQWRIRARERTGPLFEVCACLGAESERFKKFGSLLGLAYHANQDIKAVELAKRYGVASNGALQHGVLSAPASIAHQRAPDIERLFLKQQLTPNDRKQLLNAYKKQANVTSVEILSALIEETTNEANRLRPKDASCLEFLVDKVALM